MVENSALCVCGVYSQQSLSSPSHSPTSRVDRMLSFLAFLPLSPPTLYSLLSLSLSLSICIKNKDEERLLMVEQKRKMDEERRALEKAQKKAIKAQQDMILNRRGNRQRLSFTVASKSE